MLCLPQNLVYRFSKYIFEKRINSSKYSEGQKHGTIFEYLYFLHFSADDIIEKKKND